MGDEELIPRAYPTKEEMLNRVARYQDLKGFDGGLADSNMPNAMRFLFNVIGFQPHRPKTVVSDHRLAH